MRLHVRCYLWREGLLLDAGQFGRPQARIEAALHMHLGKAAADQAAPHREAV